MKLFTLDKLNFNEFRKKLKFENIDTTEINFKKVNNKNQIEIKTDKNQIKKIIGKNCPLMNTIKQEVFSKVYQGKKNITQMNKIIEKLFKLNKVFYGGRSPYIGELKDGKPNGIGKVDSEEYGKYIGEWKDGYPFGIGEL